MASFLVSVGYKFSRLCVFNVQQLYNKCDSCLRNHHSDHFRLTSLSGNSLGVRLKYNWTQRYTRTTAKMTTSFSIRDYDAFGFDLDHTIAKYNLVNLFNTAYDCVTDFLVNERGYDSSIRGDLHQYKDFIFKGLFLDVKKGNILKLGHDGSIQRATHGTHKMTAKKIREVYGEDLKSEFSDTVKQTLRNSIMDYRFFENYFDCPGLVATARIVDLIDKEESLSMEKREELYTKAWTDTIDSLHNMYSPQNFSEAKGGFFPIVKKDPSKYVLPCSEGIRQWLKSLRQDNKLVFLLTSSHIDYAACLLEVCLG